MQRVLQESMMKTQMEAQAAIEQQTRHAEHQLQEVRAETELNCRLCPDKKALQLALAASLMQKTLPISSRAGQLWKETLTRVSK